jgi:hypothetical protein
MPFSTFEAVVVVGPRHRTSLSPTLARRVAELLQSRRGRASGAVARRLADVRPGARVDLNRRQERVFHSAVLEVTTRHRGL